MIWELFGHESKFSAGDRVRVIAKDGTEGWEGVIVPANYSDVMAATAVLLDKDTDQMAAFYSDNELELVTAE